MTGSPVATPGSSGPGSSPLRYRSAAGRWVIAASVLGSGIAALDATVVGIALPTIGRDFHTGLGPLQWVVTAYTLTLAAFLLLGGTLGDRFGRRRIFSIGVAWFAVTSMACGLAPNADFLIAMRALQGIGAALLTPGSLAILQASFDPEDRAQAIGAWSGLGGLTTAAGPLIGGYLISVASWRWVFFINVPIVVVVLVLTARHVPESRDPTTTGALDTTGAALGIVWLAAITYALIEGPSLGWSSPVILTMLGIAGAGLVAFLVVEQHKRSPMLPLSLFRIRQFSATNAVTFVVYAALGGALFLLPIELQVVSGYSPLESGLALLPVTVIMLLFSARSGRLATRLGPRLQMGLGPIVVGVGLALLVRSTDGANYILYVLPAVLIFGAGLAITVAPLTSTAMSSVAVEHAGLASAVNNDVARTGGLIAVAVLPALAGITGDTYLHAQQFADGFRTAVAISAGACIAGGILAAAAIRNPPRPAPLPGTVTPVAECMHCALEAPPVRT
ncbi:MAG: MFS transporter [Acidimicrobiales bacterium]